MPIKKSDIMNAVDVAIDCRVKAYREALHCFYPRASDKIRILRAEIENLRIIKSRTN